MEVKSGKQKQGSVTPAAADVGDPEKCVWANAKVASQSSCCTGGKQEEGVSHTGGREAAAAAASGR